MPRNYRLLKAWTAKSAGKGARLLSGLAMLAIFSCQSEDKESSGSAPAEQNPPSASEAKQPARPEAPKQPAFPPLSSYDLDRIGRSSVLVRVSGHPDRHGVILKTKYGSASGQEYLIVCEVPEGVEEIAVAVPVQGGMETAFAERVADSSSGLSICKFVSKQSFSAVRLDESAQTVSFYAVRLAEDGVETGSAPSGGDLEEVREKIKQVSAKKTGLSMAYRQRMQRVPGNNTHPDYTGESMQLERELAELRQAEGRLRAKALFPAKAIKVSEIAAAKEADALGVPENALLVTSAQSVAAIRHGGRWVSIKDILESSGGKILSADLKLTGYNQSLTVSCGLNQLLPLGENGYSMVAASTFELEALAGGSVEERLAAVERVRFSSSADNPSVSKQINWNGQPSKVWVRVYSDKEPDKPLLDEVIRVSYAERLVASWDKPPSPLIALPDPPRNQPEDLVSLAKTIGVESEILDIIAAGDGSVVMIRTEGEPFWAPLDLKSGEWLPAKWKASANTLLAAQAGKLYLLDRVSRVMEIRDLATGERQGFQLLSFEGNAIAFGAPLLNPDKPVMVATDKGVHFFDPIRFEAVISGMDFRNNFDNDERSNSGSFMDPASISVRVAGDGSIYCLRGWNRSQGRNERLVDASVVLDSSCIAVASRSEQTMLPSKGRTRSRSFPDHGGGRLELTPAYGHEPFPGSAGKIDIREIKDNRALASLNDLPVLPPIPGRSRQNLADDRGCYFDSVSGTLLVPNGKEIHFRKLDLPPMPSAAPPFLLAGESLEIPLAPGSGHTITSEYGGTSETEGGVIRWRAPVSQERTTHTLKLAWQGELGSRMEEEHRVDVITGIGMAEVVSPDGKARLPMKLRGILPSGESLDGIAGSGHIAFSESSGKVLVHNLTTCELLHEIKTSANSIFGDADNLYLFENRKKLTVIDIASGQMLVEKEFPRHLDTLTTGSSSRLPLLAVEEDGSERMLLMVDRKTLNTRITELTDELKRGLFAADLVSNASGSTMCSRQVTIQRDGRAITVRNVPRGDSLPIMDGIPDATGRFILDRNMICDVSGAVVKVVQIPGTENGALGVSMDSSGRYLILYPRSAPMQKGQISVRAVADPGKDLFRIELSSRLADMRPWLVSESRSFVCSQYSPLGTRQIVYELDIPAILNELKR